MAELVKVKGMIGTKVLVTLYIIDVAQCALAFTQKSHWDHIV